MLLGRFLIDWGSFVEVLGVKPDDYLAKPLFIEKLVPRIQAVIRPTSPE